MPADEEISLREASRRSGVPASTLTRWAEVLGMSEAVAL